MAEARRICVFTGTRAEYGLLYWVLRELDATAGVDLRLIVSGAHLSPEHGLTVRVIEADGFRVDAKVEMLLASDTAVGVAKSLGLATIGAAEALDRIRPDLLVVLGDRYEALAVAQAALLARVPIAHLHGGEATEGAVDEAIRHAITKMAHLHLVAAEPFRRRVVQLGEDPERVHVVGAPGLDHLERLDLLSRDALAAALGVELRTPTLLVTYHPATLGAADPAAALAALLAGLDRHDTATVLLTRPNADAGGRAIAAGVDAYAAARPDRVRVFASLGQRHYLSALRCADVVVGNSSSGLIEAPAVGTPTVNVGERQRGRLRSASVIDCAETPEAIAAAIDTALSAPFRRLAAQGRSPYGDGRAAPLIARLLASADLHGVLAKRFHDRP